MVGVGAAAGTGYDGSARRVVGDLVDVGEGAGAEACAAGGDQTAVARFREAMAHARAPALTSSFDVEKWGAPCLFVFSLGRD